MPAEKSLQCRLGVRRPNLYVVLGPEFAARLHVAAHDVPEVAFAKVAWQLGKVIVDNFRDQLSVAILRATYNLDWDPELTGRDLHGRREVLFRRYGKGCSPRYSEDLLTRHRRRFLDHRMTQPFPEPPAGQIDRMAAIELAYLARWAADHGSANNRANRMAAGADRRTLTDALPSLTLHFLVDRGQMVTTGSGQYGDTLCAFTHPDLLRQYRAQVPTTATEVHTSADGRRVLAYLRAHRVGLALDPLGSPGRSRGHHWLPEELDVIRDWSS